MYSDDDGNEQDECVTLGHLWKGQRQGGSPDTAEAAEYVCYCDRCGKEKTDDD